MAYTYSAAALIAGHTALRDLLDVDASPATIGIYDSLDTLLAEFTLTDPCGTIDVAGQFTLTASASTIAATATGTAAYAAISDGAGLTHLTIDCIVGAQAISGYCVLNDLALVATQDITLVGMVIG